MSSFETPICLILFKRPDCTERVLNTIRQIRPTRLYVIADGPRPHVSGEREQCLATQRILDTVDWDCEVILNRAIANQGSRQRIITGLNWLFSQVEHAIILEDDCLPDLTFFDFCAELLERYASEPSVAAISGNNFQMGHPCSGSLLDISPEQSYYFSQYPSIWGWATWRRAWGNYDPDMLAWPALRDQKGLESMLPNAHTVATWANVFELAYQGLTAWDYPWIFACFLHQGLTIVPAQNLVRNIGFDQNAAGGFDLLPECFIRLLGEMPCQSLRFPLQHPTAITTLSAADRFTQIFVQDLYWHTDLGQCWLRHEIAVRWLSWTTALWNQLYIQACTQHVLNSNLRGKWMVSADQALIDDLKSQLAQETDSPDQLKYLLVAMLYLHPHQLPRFFNPSELPEWLLENYLNFMLNLPNVFEAIGEADAYGRYLQDWVGFLHEQITQNPQNPLWQKVAAHFVQKSDFMMVYFNDLNLKNLYQQRAAILEIALRQQGCELDYEFPPRSPERTQIRLGILAYHFSPHTETYTTLPMFKHLNRDRFEVILFTVKVFNHRLERFCGGHADTLVQLPNGLPQQVEMLREADLDILWIGSNVSTLGSSPITQLACHRLARLQVAGTSCCTTTGMRTVSHYLSGELTEHSAAQAQYTETLINLAGPAHTHDFGSEEQLLPTIQVSRADLSLTGDEVVYVSGANFFKITPELEDAWIKILAGVTNSRLILYPFNKNWSETYPQECLEQRLNETLKRHNLSADRVLLLSPVPNRADVQERLKLADIYLDSFPFAGVNSLIDPLELGLPSVVKDGQQFRSRMGAAFLRDLDIPELIADSEEAYIQIAIALGTQPELRAQLRDRILAKMPTCRFRNSHQYSAQINGILQTLFYDAIRAELTESLRLQTYNWVIFPDWSQDEEILGAEIGQVIYELAANPMRSETTLIIDLNGYASEDANLLISGIAMSLMMDAEINLDEGPEISLVDGLNGIEWKALGSVVDAIAIENQRQNRLILLKN